jgi:hypothetical protein
VLEVVAPGKGSARWSDGGVARAAEFEAVLPSTLPDFPQEPARLQPLPANFVPAYVEAVRTTARESVRYALSHVQLRGKSGELVATDGKQLLVQGGFNFPWKDDVLVPGLPCLGSRELQTDGPAAVGRTSSTSACGSGPGRSCWAPILPSATRASMRRSPGRPLPTAGCGWPPRTWLP